MKKTFAILLVMAMMLSFATAFASAPSITTEDVTRITVKAPARNETDGIRLVIIPMEISEEDLKAVEDFLKENDMIAYFPGDVQQEIAAVLPEGVEASALQLFEMKDIIVENAGTVEGKYTVIEVTVTLDTVFTRDQAVVALAGADGVWEVLDAEVLENGSLAIAFPVEMLSAMEKAEDAKLVILATPAD